MNRVGMSSALSFSVRQQSTPVHAAGATNGPRPVSVEGKMAAVKKLVFLLPARERFFFRADCPQESP
jgi:hypothetical protein